MSAPTMLTDSARQHVRTSPSRATMRFTSIISADARIAAGARAWVGWGLHVRCPLGIRANAAVPPLLAPTHTHPARRSPGTELVGAGSSQCRVMQSSAPGTELVGAGSSQCRVMQSSAPGTELVGAGSSQCRVMQSSAPGTELVGAGSSQCRVMQSSAPGTELVGAGSSQWRMGRYPRT
jgi:hypothetical protein